MKHIIVGTAGHIDHGKTTLIKALTGINTDRLEEEQKRGISIELGFSHFDLDNHQRIGIIDVPGHEKFLKNMLAGVAGMDLVMLIVSADEGVMPQTREHLDILDLIGLQKGIVVITKIDKVEEDFLPLVEEDIKESIQGTFLQDAPVVLVDSVSKKGLDQLIQTIADLSQTVDGRNELSPARMYIDRIFTVKGFGNVVTGTLVEGIVRLEDELLLYPDEQRVKVRGIQVHSQKEEAAYAGQRVAINLAGIDKEKIERGDTLALAGTMSPTMMIDCKVKVLPTAHKDVEHWDRIRVYHGARELLGRIVPLEGDRIARDQEGYAQIRLEEEFACKAGDKIIIRSYSPMETIAGAQILDANAKKHSAADEALLEAFAIKEAGEPKDMVESYLYTANQLVDTKELIEKLSFSGKQLQEMTLELEQEGKLRRIGNWLIHTKAFEGQGEKAGALLEKYHAQNPLKKGMSKEEFRSRMDLKIKSKEYDSYLEQLGEIQNLVVDTTLVKRKDFKMAYTKEQEQIKEEILDRLKKEELTPSLVKDYIDNPQKQQVLEGMLEEELIIKVSEDLMYDKAIIEKLTQEVKGILATNQEITMNDLREQYELSRKFTIALLEYFDRVKVTRRMGDKRLAY